MWPHSNKAGHTDQHTFTGTDLHAVPQKAQPLSCPWAGAYASLLPAKSFPKNATGLALNTQVCAKMIFSGKKKNPSQFPCLKFCLILYPFI